MEALSWISFDLDGTLAAFPFSKLVFPVLRARYGPEVVASMVASQLRASTESTAPWVYDWDLFLRQALPPHQPAIALAPLIEERCASLSDAAGLLYDDALPVLQRLVTSGFRLMLLTNGLLTYQQPIVEALGLSRYFARLVTPEDTGVVKPHPHFFRPAADQAVLAHVGDTLIHDIAGAQAAGLRAIWLCRDLKGQNWRDQRPEQRGALDALQALIASRLAQEDPNWDGRVSPDAIAATLDEVQEVLTRWQLDSPTRLAPGAPNAAE